MNKIKESQTIKSLCEIATESYRQGWDERNGGNISIIIDEQYIIDTLNEVKAVETLPLKNRFLTGKFIAITGTGSYFRNLAKNPEEDIGIIRINNDGNVEIVWGFKKTKKPTSELDTHLLAHSTRLALDPLHRVVIHSHPTNTIAMTFIHPLDSKSFTTTLWRMMTECVIVFPDGVGILEWMVCGNRQIGEATVSLLKEQRAVVWAYHGIFATGKTLDETFGLIETIEKSANLYIKTHKHRITEGISDSQLRDLAKAFDLQIRKGYIS